MNGFLVHETVNSSDDSDFLVDSLHCHVTILQPAVDREIRSGMNPCWCGIVASFGCCSQLCGSQSRRVFLKEEKGNFRSEIFNGNFLFVVYAPRLGDGERLSARELLEDDDLRRRPLDDRRLPLLRRLSTDESDLDRLVERDGFRVFLTGLLQNETTTKGEVNKIRLNATNKSAKLTWILTD